MSSQYWPAGPRLQVCQDIFVSVAVMDSTNSSDFWDSAAVRKDNLMVKETNFKTQADTEIHTCILLITRNVYHESKSKYSGINKLLVLGRSTCLRPLIVVLDHN